jgi:protein-L-isoaspartate(D-aspartate) O-methyltransferase
MEEKYFEMRQKMIRDQLLPRGISNEKVLKAFLNVPRHKFVTPAERPNAYEDNPLPIGQGQTISQPYIVALMTESLALKGWEKVLEIGTGTGYQTAILAELAAHVYTIERIPQLAEAAQKTLFELKYDNISFKVGDGRKGWPEVGPFEGILVAAAAEEIPPSLLEQLSIKGRMVIPVEKSMFVQDLLLLTKGEEGFKKQILCSCRFVPLVKD